MKKCRLALPALLLALVCTARTPSFGQSEKVTIPRLPAPNQTIKLKMVQDVQLEMNMGGGLALPGLAGPMRMGTKTNSTETQKVGAPNTAGVTETEVTIEESTVEMSLNGQPVPAPTGSTDSLAGKKVTLAVDKEGKLVDVKGMPDLAGARDAFVQALKAASGNLPATPLGIGEEASAPLDLALALPIGGGSPLKVSGEVRYKLVSIDKDPDGSRIARFDVTTQGSMASNSETPSPIPGMQMNMNIKMSGSGTAFHDLDKGVVKSSETRTTLSGTIDMGGPGLPIPPMTMQGLIVQTINRVN